MSAIILLSVALLGALAYIFFSRGRWRDNPTEPRYRAPNEDSRYYVLETRGETYAFTEEALNEARRRAMRLHF